MPTTHTKTLKVRVKDKHAKAAIEDGCVSELCVELL